MESRIRLAAFALSLVIVTSHAAFGQSSSGSVSVTCTLLRDADLDVTFARGSLGGADRLHEWLFVAAELALSTHHEDYRAVQGGADGFRYQSLHAGARVAHHPLSLQHRPGLPFLSRPT